MAQDLMDAIIDVAKETVRTEAAILYRCTFNRMEGDIAIVNMSGGEVEVSMRLGGYIPDPGQNVMILRQGYTLFLLGPADNTETAAEEVAIQTAPGPVEGYDLWVDPDADPPAGPEIPDLSGYQQLTEKGVPDGYAPLGSDGRVPPENLPPGTAPVSDHGGLTGLADNDHPQYTLTSRNLAAGNGLTGGGALTADRTFDVVAGFGISVTADAVALNTSQTDARYVNEDQMIRSTSAPSGTPAGGTGTVWVQY